MAIECPVCEGHAEVKRELREITVEGRTVTAEHEFIYCGSCNEEYFTPEMMDDTLRRAAEVIRHSHGVISAADIFSLRSTLGFSQAEFEAVLGTGPKTVTRWERGTIVPSGAANTLLRVLKEHPDIAHQIAREKGIRTASPLRRVSPTHVNRLRPTQRVAEATNVFPLGNSLTTLLRDLEDDVVGETAPSLPFQGPRWSMYWNLRETAH